MPGNIIIDNVKLVPCIFAFHISHFMFHDLYV